MFSSSHIGKIIFVSVDHYTKLCYVVVNQYQFNVKIFSPNMYLGNIKHIILFMAILFLCILGFSFHNDQYMYLFMIHCNNFLFISAVILLGNVEAQYSYLNTTSEQCLEPLLAKTHLTMCEQ